MNNKLFSVSAGLVVVVILVNIFTSGRPAHAAGAGAAPVTVVNTPLPVSPPQPAATAFKLVLCIGTNADQCTNQPPSSATIPADRVAVVEGASAICEAASTDPAIVPGVSIFSIESTSGITAPAAP